MPAPLRSVLVTCLLWAAAGAPLLAQGSTQTGGRRDLRESQLRLDSIRQERARLQREMQSLQTRVRDASRDLVNIGRQRAAQVSALQEMDFQAAVLETTVEQTSAELEATRSALEHRGAALRERVRDIYKRGPLHTVSVLLSAENFGDLLNRYKYLSLVTRYERMVVDDVRRLEAELRSQEETLREDLTQLESLRARKGGEVDELRRIEARTRQALDQVKREEASTADELEKAAQDEQRVSAIIDRIERERIAEERRGAAATPNAISTSDLGSLNWPVEGRVVYRFGPERKPNGITLLNNGIGIAAAAGSPVRAVEAGRVSHAGPFEGYGSMVMVNHGGGYYTLYMYLRSVSVSEGEMITAGQVIGLVGGEQTPEGPHLEFQVRAPVRSGVPEPVDPLSWLRSRASS
jgi:septal ring factor EnvC (AmiA/AmiB activator)